MIIYIYIYIRASCIFAVRGGPPGGGAGGAPDAERGHRLSNLL